MSHGKEILSSEEMAGMITRMVFQILESARSSDNFGIVGIKSGGDVLARRIADEIAKHSGKKPDVGYLDITLYRDDLSQTQIADFPVVRGTEISFSVTGRYIILVDDVVFTGRTVRAALDALTDFGRPSKISLAALIDRGHRELPIQPDFTGKSVPTALSESVQVNFRETAGADSVCIMKK
ncbi:MAG: bifunctional pyr operon transcriptional regulator/uracil phosphoribosyltransferase PyrR [Deferribacterales bacterium]